MVQGRAPTDETLLICPFYGFKCAIEDSERIDLGGGVAIWRMPHNLRALVDRRIPELALRLNQVEWAIQIPRDPKGRETPTERTRTTEEFSSLGYRLHDDVREIMIGVVTALRLQHAGSVAPGKLVYVLSSGQEFEYGSVTS